MNRLRLSIVTPTLNSIRYLEECLESIHGSPRPEITIEHIVVDGGSQDGTLDLARRYPCLIIRDEDEGLYDAMNIGIRRAEGDVVAILNSDDSLIPGALTAVAEWYGRRRADWAVGGIRWIDADGAVRAELPAPPRWMPLRVFASLGWNCLHHGATFITRDFYRRIGEYDTSYPIAADYELLARALADHPFDRIRRPLANFRRHDGSTSLNAGPAARRDGDRIAARYGPTGEVRRRVYGTSLRLWLNATNPRWFMAKRLGST